MKRVHSIPHKTGFWKILELNRNMNVVLLVSFSTFEFENEINV